MSRQDVRLWHAGLPEGWLGVMVQLAETDKTLARFQVVNALIWGLTILASAVVVKASDNFIYLLLVLVAGSTASWAVIRGLLVRGETPAQSSE